MNWRIAIDTGGTFTDLVAQAPDGTMHRLKVPSNRESPSAAIKVAYRALAKRAGLPLSRFLQAGCTLEHGTTVATNALLERRGAAVVLVTNRGFEDVLALRRQARPDLFALHPMIDAPLIPQSRCLGLRGRLDARGQELEPIEDLPRWFADNRAVLMAAEAIAVGLLHSPFNADHERAVADFLRERLPGKPLSCSHELCATPREYERFATAAANAYLQPLMSGYLAQLAEFCAESSLAVMGSDGALIAVEHAAKEPIQTVLSGPAGGLRGAWALAQGVDLDAVLALDIGGTSTDVAALVGEPTASIGTQLAGLPLEVPLLPIETVGAGGGSIAWLDEAGLLRVGPQSAGADPGPACYGRGGVAPTVTDAHVVLGRLDHLLGGEFPLDVPAAKRVVQCLADGLDSSLEATAQAMIDLAEATMLRACKRVTAARGIDPRGLPVVAYGGAGGLHACAVAEAIGSDCVVFAQAPGTLSAEGILQAPPGRQSSRTLMLAQARWSAEQIEADCLSLAARLPGQDHQFSGLLRYEGQADGLPIVLSPHTTPKELRSAFEADHERQFGHRLDRPLEWVALTARVEGKAPAITKGEMAMLQREGPRTIQGYGATLWLPKGWVAERQVSGAWLARLREAGPVTVKRRMGLSVEIHRQRLAAITEEMGEVLRRSALSTNIRERRDASCAVFDQRGQMLSHAAHIPVHLGAAPASVSAVLKAMDLGPGQTALLNDPQAGGTHLPDLTMVTCVGLGGARALVLNRAHHADVGGIEAGSLPAAIDAQGQRRSLSLADEGVCIPPMLLNDDVVERVAKASRAPDERRGDLAAQLSANQRGAKRLLAYVARVGLTEFERLNDGLLDASERRMRALITDWPQGEFCVSDSLDLVGGDALQLTLVLRIKSGLVEVDLSAFPDAVDQPLNAPRAVALAACFYVLRTLAGQDVPANAGMLRCLRLVTRSGSLLDPPPDAPVSAGNVETSQRLVDLLFAAFRQALPGCIPAASAGTMSNLLFAGVDPATGARFVHYETIAGGAGAGPQGPGADAIQTHMTNTLNTPIERLEQVFPVRVERYALRPRLTSSHEHQGGCGVVRRIRFLVPTEVTLMAQRYRSSPGQAGRADVDGEAIAGQASLRLASGQVLTIKTPSGEGWTD